MPHFPASVIHSKVIHESLTGIKTIKIFTSTDTNYHDLVTIEGTKAEFVKFARDLIHQAGGEL